MEHGEELAAVETALRAIVREIAGDDGWQSLVGVPDLDRLRDKQAEARRRRDGAVVSDDLLAFVEFHHLTGLIERNWDKFKPVFDDLQRTKVFFGILADYRNDVAHSRELNAFEKHLLIGAAGQLRNQVALYRGRASVANNYYPVIERVADAFGNIGEEWGVDTHLRLNVGDCLTFDCRGIDPRGRTLEWSIDISDGNTHPFPDDWVTMARGDNVRLSLTITEEMVGEGKEVEIWMRNAGRFHLSSRPGSMRYDDKVMFVYAVNPPE